MSKAGKAVIQSGADSVIEGEVALRSASGQSFAGAQVQLLAAISDTGSISAAAKQVGISYKTAWDRIDTMNNMAEQPLVERSAGGAKGGGTQITPYGLKVLSGFQALREEHQAYLDRLGKKLHSMADVAGFMRVGAMQTSARNQFRGRISKITPGAVNTEVMVEISSQQSLIAIVTEESAHLLDLNLGDTTTALINGTAVLISPDTEIITSARNKLIGTVLRITRGAVNSDLVLDLGEGKSIGAVITNTSLDELQLKEGTPACALFKAPSVILMKEG